MFNRFLLLACCTFFPLIAEEAINSQVGKYQMMTVGIKGAHYLYLLDTTNGCIWRAVGKNSWTEFDTWELYISQIPPQP